MSQAEEIKTIKERTVKLNLSDEDVKRIYEKAGASGLTVSQLLENFIGDLVYGTYTNGSDERMYADQWFSRCGFNWMNGNTFLKYLIEYDDVEDTVVDWNEIKYYKSLETLNEDDKEELEWLEENLNDKYEDFLGQLKVKEKAPALSDEMEKVIKWWQEYKLMKEV